MTGGGSEKERGHNIYVIIHRNDWLGIHRQNDELIRVGRIELFSIRFFEDYSTSDGGLDQEELSVV